MYFSLSCSQNVRFFVILHSVLSPSAPRSTLVVCDKLAKWFLTPQKSSDFWGTKKSEKIFLVCSENARPHLRTKVGRVSREHFPTFKNIIIYLKSIIKMISQKANKNYCPINCSNRASKERHQHLRRR